ncbi:hypothetical protein [Pseudogemmobacter sonorensis]|uniref:hypothetical protein n=1 Tax=Pseudogemmobacter sonorensis TaxID=2989681 RepID=UPI0036818972
MNNPDIPTSDPEVSSPAPDDRPRGGGVGAEQWIMKSLNDLREDMRDLKGSVGGMDTRLGSLERKIMRAIWTVGGGVIVIGLLWTGWQILTSQYNITLTPKAESTAQASPASPGE